MWRRPIFRIVVCTALLAFGASLTVSAQNNVKEPISIIGHGAMFDRNGREVPPSLGFIREAQAWYRQDLLRKVPSGQRAEFENIEKRVTTRLTLDAQSRVVASANLLDWLIARADLAPQQRERLIGKNNLMKRELETRMSEEPKGRSVPRSLERFTPPPELFDRLRKEGVTKDRLFERIVTTTGGAAYRTLCAANGVPIPPDWDMSGATGWVNQGQIPSTDVFISPSLQAEVFTYHSTSPEGMCIALPRYNGANSIRLLGIICLGKVSSKACFFDNDIGGSQFFPNVGQVVPLANFGGGNDLINGGMCTDCHAGENPYIIHPTTVLGNLAGLGLPTFADNWYEPIVKPGWIQNPGPMPSSGACAGCHSAGSSGGRFPHISTEYQFGYCPTIFDQAVIRTMPDGAPGTLIGNAHPVFLRSLCGLAAGGSAATRGDPHLTTVDGINYDFQAAGEFVALRSNDGFEIQTRQAPVSTQIAIGPNGHTGLTNCVSLNTAVAARVGTRRVSYQPKQDGSSFELRVDGGLTTLGAGGLNLGSGGRIAAAATGDGIEIDFPNGSRLSAVPGLWGPPHNRSYLNLDILNFSFRQGIMGNVADNWLPGLPNGTSLGPRPASLTQRYTQLYRTFADAWRVNARTSLFDYASGTSTATFTNRAWPPQSGSCVIPRAPLARPVDRGTAVEVCREVTDKNMNAECVFDVTVTGDKGFAKTYLASQRLRAGATTVIVGDDQDPTRPGATVRFTANVSRPAGKELAAGTAQFIVDGERVGTPVRLVRGTATWQTSDLKPGVHQVAAAYMPDRGSPFFAAMSADESHTVRGERPAASIANLPMQAGDEKTACPATGVTYKRADAEKIPYLRAVLPTLDKQCATKGQGLVTDTVRFLRCAADPRGKGFGPNASADVTCSK